jgi:hypothetical protein
MQSQNFELSFESERFALVPLVVTLLVTLWLWCNLPATKAEPNDARTISQARSKPRMTMAPMR